MKLSEFERIIKRSDMIKCTLCYDAPCSSACPHAVDPAAKLRSVWFDNENGAAASLTDTFFCRDCPAPCENACLRPGEVPVKALMTRIHDEISEDLIPVEINEEELLKTDICGIPLENPFFLSSSVVASTYDMCARAFDAGWAGVSFKTICNFEIHEASPRYSAITGDNGTIIGFKNIEQLSDHSVKENMEIFNRLKKNYPSKFILASIMGQNEQEWMDLARMCEDNGADAIELNFSCPNMAEDGLGSDIGQVPELVEKLTEKAKSGCSIPVLAKLTPNVDSMLPAALAARRGGADGFSAINTIKSIIGVNPHTYISAPAVHGMSAVGGYSGNAVKPIALRFINEIASEPAFKGMHISGMGGIETWRDAFEFILLGCTSLQVTTAVMQYGNRIIDDLKTGLSRFIAEKGFSNIREAVGLAVDSVDLNTDNLERDTILFPKFNQDRCIGCGRCVISCRDGGHQAIRFTENRMPMLDGSHCVGCHLCLLVCPQGAITSGRKRITRIK